MGREGTRHTHGSVPFLLHAELKDADGIDMAAFPFSLPSVRQLGRLHLGAAVTVFVGENGSGKSSLLEGIAVACGFNQEGGSKNFDFGTRPSHSELHKALRVARARPIRHGYFLRAESFFNVATHIEKLDAVPSIAPLIIDSYGGRSLHEQSHGESFMALLKHRFGADGLYILDEPEAALSIKNQLEALAHIRALASKGAQFLIATHSPVLMAYPGALIYELGAHGVRQIAYGDVDHVVRMRQFMTDPEAAVAQVLNEAPEGDALASWKHFIRAWR